jgi:ubiquinone/menaquinone biosynthesis C-methylase UbiE
MPFLTQEHAMSEHYSSDYLTERMKHVFDEIGFDRTAPIPLEKLAPLDQFHSRGLAATKELAGMLGLSSEDKVLDIGSGLGGPSRYLASTYGCHVQGIDLSRSFVDAASYLAQRTGLDTRVSYACADALDLPFDADTFDVAWTQHVAMNIEDRAALYREAFRVLRAGGRFAMFDVVAVSGEPLHYPVPWARTSDTSFLKTADEMRGLLTEQGFRVTSWTDCTADGIAWFEAREKERASMQNTPALGLHLVMGPDFADMSRNLGRNLSEGRAALIQAIVCKP